MSFTIALKSSRDLCGLYEITREGTILYSRIRKNNALLNMQPEIVGKNLFDDVLSFDNTAAFRRRVESFWNAPDSMQSFFFNSKFADNELRLKVLLLCVNQSNYTSVEKFVIVDIRKSASVPGLEIY